MSATYRIGELAASLSVPVETIRHYEHEELLPKPARSEGNYRLYSQSERERLEVLAKDLTATLMPLVKSGQVRVTQNARGIGIELNASVLFAQGEAVLQLRFRIDISQFPRPLQIGALGRSGWNLLVTHTERVDLGVLQ